MTATADPSRRHVLTDDAPYLRNLAALWTHCPELASAIEALPDENCFTVEPTKSGPPTVAVAGPNGRPIYLHTRYNPVEEAKRLIDPIELDEKVAFYVHGFGLGYHVEQLFDRASEETIICIFEPDLALLKTAFMHRDVSRLFEHRRVMFFTRPDKSDFLFRLQPFAALTSFAFDGVAHAPSLQLQPDFHREMQTVVAEYASYMRTSIATLISNGRRTCENIARNIGWYIATPSLDRLKDQRKKQPAIVVSAGPSLRKNKDLLKDAQNNAVIIAVQTTLQPLLELGVEPHFVTSLDYHDICTRFFEKLPPALKTELVAEPKATNAIFTMNPGPLTLLGNDFAEALLRENRPKKAGLPAGATVAHLAYYLAEHLGCDPIIFVGQDLGFGDGLCYAPGTSYDDVWQPDLGRFCTTEMKQWEQIIRDRNILRKIPDYLGAPMYTEERLFTYLQQFERDFAKSTAKIIDATEGGARKQGTVSMTLAAALEEFCQAPLLGTIQPHTGLCWDRLPDCLNSLRARRDEAGEIESICQETLPLLEEVRDHLDDQPRVNRTIARIDALRARMDRFNFCYELIMQLTQLSELRKFRTDRVIAASRLTGLEKQRRQVGRDVENVRSIVDAAREFRTLLAQVIDTWQSSTYYPQPRGLAA